MKPVNLIDVRIKNCPWNSIFLSIINRIKKEEIFYEYIENVKNINNTSIQDSLLTIMNDRYIRVIFLCKLEFRKLMWKLVGTLHLEKVTDILYITDTIP